MVQDGRNSSVVQEGRNSSVVQDSNEEEEEVNGCVVQEDVYGME